MNQGTWIYLPEGLEATQALELLACVSEQFQMPVLIISLQLLYYSRTFGFA